MKKRWMKLFVAALLCVGIWGCSELESHDGPIEWDETRTIGKVIGFIDDSLLIVSDWRGWSQELTEFVTNLGGYRTGIGHQGLRVYNYRVQEDGPRWADSLNNENTNDFIYLVGQVSDSVIWGGNGNDSFSFWKLGQNPIVMNVDVSKDGCNLLFKQEKMRTWLNGKILLKGPMGAGGDSCQYAVLDTVAKLLTYKRLDKDLEWIKTCDDVRAWDEKVYCVVLDDGGENSLVLKNELDSIPVPRKFAIGGFWGNMIKMNGNICRMNDDEIICTDVMWRGNGDGLKFYQNGSVIAEY